MHLEIADGGVSIVAEASDPRPTRLRRIQTRKGSEADYDAVGASKAGEEDSKSKSAFRRSPADKGRDWMQGAEDEAVECRE